MENWRKFRQKVDKKSHNGKFHGKFRYSEYLNPILRSKIVISNSVANFFEEMSEQETTTRQPAPALRWCFTINNPVERDMFWTDGDVLAQLKYIVVQLEKGEQGTVHYQGFLILKNKKRMSWLKNNFNNKAHWEKTHGTDKQASDYCKKDDTHIPGGLRFEHGKLPRDKDDTESDAVEFLTRLRAGYIRPADIPAELLMSQNFIPAYKLLTSDVNGPYRPNLKIITLVSPPGCGKSYLINKLFPDAARLLMGNTGSWWENASSKVGVIEEFIGQVSLQKMLRLLDPYPQSLEVKGGTRPCMFEVIFITSNSSPEQWYAPRSVDEPLQEKRHEALLALYDRIGYHPTWHHGTLSRKCGHYLEPPQLGPITEDWILESRRWLMQEVRKILDLPEEQPAAAAQPAGEAAQPAALTDTQLLDALGLNDDDDFEPNTLRRQDARSDWSGTDLF